MTEGLYITKSRSNGYYAERASKKTRSFIVGSIFITSVYMERIIMRSIFTCGGLTAHA
jgi:hypothetical protein